MRELIPCRPVKMVIYSTPAQLAVVRATLEKACELAGFDAKAAGEVVLSVDEALANVIEHAYGGADDQPIEIELMPLGDSHVEGLRIRLRDYGRAVDPATIRGRDLDDVRPGGLGVHIMHRCMDEVDYQPAKGKGSVLTMFKRHERANQKEQA